MSISASAALVRRLLSSTALARASTAAALLAVLPAAPAFAQSYGATGGAGGLDIAIGNFLAGGTGGNAATSGTAATGGDVGDSGPSLSGGAGGGAGTSGSPAGGDGTGQTGGGGGGGGAGYSNTSVSTAISGNLTGGNGGVGGGTTGGGAGGGGAGGDGLVSTATSNVSITSGVTIQGGNGGAGGLSSGTAFASGGDGGTGSGGAAGGSRLGGNVNSSGGGGGGGAGIAVATSGITLTNNGTVNGGAGGSSSTSDGFTGAGGGGGGAGVVANGITIINNGTISGGAGGFSGNFASSSSPGGGGDGGSGIVGSNLAIVNNGTISGGAADPTRGGANGNAITLTGGVNSLELRAGSVINGNVAGATGAGTSNTLILGGAANSAFNVSAIGGQYQNFTNFQKTGASTWVLTGTTNAATPWTLSAGTLSISSDSALGASGLTFDGGTLNTTQTIGMTRATTLNGGGTFDVDSGTTLAMSGAIAGNGGLTKTDTGTLTLSGNNTYSGGTTISAGTLSISSNNNLGAATGALTFNGGTLNTTQTIAMTRATTLNGGGTFDVDSGTTLAMSGAIAGNGGLTKTDTGTLTLSGNNTYSGGTTISAGTLSISSDNNLGAATGALTFNGGTLNATQTIAMTRAAALNAGGGTFDVDSGTTLAMSGAIAGNGGLTKTDTGTLTLSANNTYSGGTTISAGTLSISSDNNLGAATGALTFNGGTLNTTQTITMTRAVTLNSGTFDVDSGATLTMNGVISGGGGFTKTGAGTLTLTNANNNYTNATINAGMLTLSGPGLISGSTDVRVASGATFDISATTNGASVKSLFGDGKIVLGGRTLTLAHPDPSFSNFTGEITGTGGLTLSRGLIFLGGTQTYTGATTINGGALELTSSASSIADSSEVSVASGARFDIVTTGASIKSLSGGGDVAIGNQTLTLTNASGTFSGAFKGTSSSSIATGGLTLSSTNTGTQTLTGANNSVGAVTVGGGTLAFAQNGVFNATSYETQSGAATTIAATAQLAVGGAFTQDAGSTLNIAVGSSNTPAITTGTVSLSGTLNIAGIGSESQLPQMLISTANGITGDFSSISIGGFSGGAVDYFTAHTGKSADDTKYLATYGLSWTANNSLAHGTFTLTNTADSFNVGVVLGDEAANSATSWDGKSLTKAGHGTLILSAANTYTGGTTITGGVLQLGDGVNPGSILGNVSTSDPNDSTKSGTLAFNEPDATTFSGVISGSGSVIQNGAGTLTLTGINTYTGATTVDAGTLVVNGSIATSSLLTVNADGTVSGTGTVGNTVINGGTLAPGNGTPGTSMSIAGNLAFQSGAIYLVQLNPTTSSFANVTGTATLGGATVAANFVTASGYVEKRYTILNAGSISGTFNPTVANGNLPSGFKTSLSYDATHAYLDLALIPFAPPSGGTFGGNQSNVGNAIVNFFNTNGSIPLVFGGLTPAGLTQLSGELGTGSQQTTFQAMNQFLGVMTDPFIAGRGDPVAAGGAPNAYAGESMAYAASGKGRAKSERDAYAAVYTKAPVASSFEQRWSVWAAGFGGSQQTDGSTAVGSNNTTSSLYGTAVGADYRLSRDTLLGFALAGGGTNFTVANNLGGGRSDLFQAGAFIRHNLGPAYLTGALAYGWQDVTTDRTLTVSGVDRLRAEFNANAWSGRAEGGYRFVLPWVGGVGLTPYAAGQFTTFDLPNYAESVLAGSSTFALSYAAKSVTDTRSELGLRTDKSFAMQDGVLTLRGRAAWAHDFNPDRAVAATFQTLPGASFVVNGAAQASDSALTTASAEMKWLNGWSAAATFEGEFSSVTRSYAGKGVVRYAW